MITIPQEEDKKLKVSNIENYNDHWGLFVDMLDALEDFASKEELMTEWGTFCQIELEKINK